MRVAPRYEPAFMSQVFKKLMSQDTADYDHLGHTAPPGNRRGGGAKVAESPAAGSPIPGDAADEEAGTPEWVLGNGTGAADSNGVLEVALALLT